MQYQKEFEKGEISEEERKLFKKIIDSSLLMLSPITPHITHELWNVLQNGKKFIVRHGLFLILIY